MLAINRYRIATKVKHNKIVLCYKFLITFVEINLINFKKMNDAIHVFPLDNQK